MGKFLIDGNITEHLGKPRCRIEWTNTDQPLDEWHGTMIEFMGDEDPPMDVPMFIGLFAEAKAALQQHRKEQI